MRWRLRFRPALLALYIASLATSALAQIPEPDPSQWLKLRSRGFVLFSNSSVTRAEQVAAHLETLQENFAGIPLLPRRPRYEAESDRPVEVLLFRDAATYLPFRLADNAPAFHIGIGGRNIIVLSDENSEALALASHEYFHVVTERAGWRLPFWLAEGMADYFSTQQRVENPNGRPMLQAGHPMPRHLQVLERTPPPALDVSRLLALDFEVNRLKEPGTGVHRYAESWLLVHMLRRQSPWKDSFPHFIEALLLSGAEHALAEVYGATTANLQQAASQYLASGGLTPESIPMSVSAESTSGVQQESPQAWELPLLFADVMAYRGQVSLARQSCERLALRFPDVPEIHESLAAIALDQLEMTRAQRHLEDAALQGSRSGEVFFRLASLVCEMQTEDARCMPWLRQALELAPRRTEILRYAADYALNTARYREALTWLDTLATQPEGSSFQLLHQQAYAHYHLEEFALANRALNKARTLATDVGQQKMVRHLERAIAEREEFSLQMQLFRDVQESEEGPRQEALARLLDRFARDPGAVLEEARLLEVRCVADSLSLLVEGPRGRIALHAENPMDLMVLQGTSRMRELDLTCGDASGISVRVGYILREAEGKVDARLRILQLPAFPSTQPEKN